MTSDDRPGGTSIPPPPAPSGTGWALPGPSGQPGAPGPGAPDPARWSGPQPGPVPPYAPGSYRSPLPGYAMTAPGGSRGTSSKKLVWGLVSGGVVLVLVVVGVVLAAASAARNRTASQTAARDAAAVAQVKEYLDAVAAADAKRVLDHLPDYLGKDGSTAS